ncbi:hypothetical protein QBC39DRAFT_174941 [Podospora conica]|nr:hypothetical protein QBC39DRAFT_174941 [Schizothecium conicum]
MVPIVAAWSGLRLAALATAVFHNLVSVSQGPCSSPDGAKAKYDTQSRLDEALKLAQCVPTFHREPKTFGLKVIAELVVSQFLPLPILAGAPYIASLGYAVVVLSVNMNAARFGAQSATRPKASIHRERICHVHKALFELNRNVQPPTFFDVLGLDPRKPPFFSAENSSILGADDHPAVRRELLRAFRERTKKSFLAVLQDMRAPGKRGKQNQSREMRDVEIKAHVVLLLLDDETRAEYQNDFVAALMGPNGDIDWANSKSRDTALKTLCPMLDAEHTAD